MQEVTTPTATALHEATERVRTALAVLRSSPDMPLERARAIAACAGNIIDTVRIEAERCAIHEGKT